MVGGGGQLIDTPYTTNMYHAQKRTDKTNNRERGNTETYNINRHKSLRSMFRKIFYKNHLGLKPTNQVSAGIYRDEIPPHLNKPKKVC